MAKPLDDDLRKRIVEAMQEAGCCRAVGRQFRVAASTVSRLMKRVERTGARAPGKMSGHRKRVLEEHRDWVAARVEARPETASKELQQDLLAERGVQAGEDTAGRFVRSLDFTFKKTLIAEERDREDAELRCEECLRDQGRMLADRLVFIDETWIKTDMVPTWGWGRKGERVRAKRPSGIGKPRPWSQACAAPGSSLPASTPARPTASYSWPISRRLRLPRSGPEASSSWTTRAPAKATPCERRLKTLTPNSGSSLLAAPTPT